MKLPIIGRALSRLIETSGFALVREDEPHAQDDTKCAERARRHTTQRPLLRLSGYRAGVMSAVLGVAFACSASVNAPPSTPQEIEPVQKSTENSEKERPERGRSPVIAPPPAYGNKVVDRAPIQDEPERTDPESSAETGRST